MCSSPNFKVDALLTSLKDLQNEKNCLEQKLNKCREKRRTCESELERDVVVHKRNIETCFFLKDIKGRFEVKYLQINDVHRKMTETLKVAQLKVTQTQAQIDSLEEANQKRRDKIASVNKSIEVEKNQQQKDVNQFEEILADLTERLVKARTYHLDENLQHELESKQKQIEDMMERLKDKQQNIERLSTTFEQIQLEEEVEDDSEIPEEIRRVLWHMLKEENQAIHSYLNKLQLDLKQIHDTSNTD